MRFRSRLPFSAKDLLAALVFAASKKLYAPIVRKRLRKSPNVFVSLFMDKEATWRDLLSSSSSCPSWSSIKRGQVKFSSGAFLRSRGLDSQGPTSSKKRRDKGEESREEEVAALLRNHLASVVLEIVMTQVEGREKGQSSGKVLGSPRWSNRGISCSVIYQKAPPS